MKIIVTGGAGFIGSCLVRMLNEQGIKDIIIVDNINTSQKWMNIRNKEFTEYYPKMDFLEKLPALKGITHILHMGACSSTVERDFDYLYQNNFNYSRVLWNYAVEQQISFIYASSAATYGNGNNGFDDTIELKKLEPLNRYGYSKHLFDLWAEKQTKFPRQFVGLKFFNVYGPNEYAKDSMASMVYHGFIQAKQNGRIKLFKSYRGDYPDGGQVRDFIYIKDICSIVRYFMKNSYVNGIFNIGTGNTESFCTLAESVFQALELKTNIEFIEMPELLKNKYQYYTRAKLDKLRKAGYKNEFFSLKDGIKDYVQNYLERGFAIY